MLSVSGDALEITLKLMKEILKVKENISVIQGNF